MVPLNHLLLRSSLKIPEAGGPRIKSLRCRNFNMLRLLRNGARDFIYYQALHFLNARHY